MAGKAGATVVLDIESLSWGGRGVGHHDGKVVFVSCATPGDRLLVSLKKIKASYAEGSIKAVLRPSSDRVTPKCKFFGHCGGCQWLSTAYERQLVEKEALVRAFLRRLLDKTVVETISPSPSPVAYRHKGTFHVKPSGGGIRSGFYQASSHKVTNLDLCLLFDKAFNELYGDLRRALRFEAAAVGLGGFVIVQSEEGSEFVVHLRFRPGYSRAEVEGLAKTVSGLGFRGVVATPSGFPERELAKEGELRTAYRLKDLSGGRDLILRADPRSFTQSNYPLNRILVETAFDWLSLSGNERLLDLYAGIGNFTLPLSKACSTVVAVESSPLALGDAGDNAAANNADNVSHLEGDAVRRTGELVERGEIFDAVILDPPRDGAGALIGTLSLLHPKRILYVSCNLPTLARDLEELARTGYTLERLRPFDLFPQTYGVETLCLLRKKSGS